MATKKKRKTWDTYADYLVSEEWAAIRKEVHRRDKGVCQICGCPKASHPQCHHWNYPSDWNEDSHNNVILACGECHSKLHDIDFCSSGADTYIAYLREYISFEIQVSDDLNVAGYEDDIETLLVAISKIVKSCRLGIIETRLHVSGGKYDPEESYYTIERSNCHIPKTIGDDLISLLKGADDVPSE